jgi:hypothetical protein
MSTSVVSKPGRFHGSARLVPALAACLLAAPVCAADAGSAPAAEGESQPAVWTDKELTFVYMGFTTRYSCDGLRDKVRGVLLDLGAQKKDLKVQQLGCSSPTGRPDPFPGVRVKMRVLQPASGTADGQTGAAAAVTSPAGTPVPAHWKPVDLKLRDSFTTDSGECELVEQIRHAIVPLFATRNVDLKTTCIPHQATAARPSLKLEVLAPDAAQHPAEAPPAAR